MEFNGDVYACDHWVEPDWLIGNIADSSFAQLAFSPRMREFAEKKPDLDPGCRSCPHLPLCWGGCPKDRFVPTASGARRNYLCEGYRAFYSHASPALAAMARLLRSGRPASDIMDPGTAALLGAALPAVADDSCAPAR